MKTLRASSIVEYEVPNHCQVPVLPFGEEKHVLMEGGVWKPFLAWRRCEEVPDGESLETRPPGFVDMRASSKLQWVKKPTAKSQREKIRRRLGRKAQVEEG